MINEETIKQRPSRRVALVLLAMAATVLASFAAVEPAQAAFPGQNGKIVYQRYLGSGNGEIYKMNPNGSHNKRFTNNPASDSDPVLSPDGKKIAFQSNRDGNDEIYTMDVAPENTTTNVPNRLTYEQANDGSPSFSPDGTKIAFTSYRDGNAEIYVMNSTGYGPPTNLTKNSASDADPAFSPDGKQIAFVSDRYGTLDLFVMNALDGSGWDHRTFGGENYSPDWGPKP